MRRQKQKASPCFASADFFAMWLQKKESTDLGKKRQKSRKQETQNSIALRSAG